MTNIVLRIANAKPIKPMVARLTVELWEANYIQGEYDIAVDLAQYTKTDVDGKLEFDVVALQQDITNQIAALQHASSIASRISKLAWVVKVNEESDNQSESSDE